MSAFFVAAQKAVFGVLSTAAIAGGRIYDHAPATVTFPWVEIGDRQGIPDDSGDQAGGSDSGMSDFIDLHIWSRYAGVKEVGEISDAIHTALHGVTLTVEGRASALAWVRSFRTLTDPDGLTQHGVVGLEVVHRS